MTRLYPLPMFRTALKKYVLFLVFFSITFSLFAQEPTITRVDANVAPYLAPIGIYGTNFTNVTAVTFAGAPAFSYQVVSPTKILAKVGRGDVSNHTIQVSTAAGTATYFGFRYAPPPEIYSITPDSAGPGQEVAIIGTGFSLYSAQPEENVISNVYFGGVPAASFTVVAYDTIKAVVAPGSASGTVDVLAYADLVSYYPFTYLPSPYARTFTLENPHTAPSGQMLLYPNPARDYVWMKHPASALAAQIQVVNAMGTVLKIVRTDPGVSQTQVNLNSIPSGYYRIVWTDGKVIKSAGMTIVY
ncbi:MAG TPA: IPT/TIG domain-containing protein [Chitinophaga sp.]